jgi:hypothetical protein
MENLRRALTAFLGSGDPISQLTHVLAAACVTGTIPYSEVEKASGEDTEDVVLVAWKWRLLVPMRMSRCGEWDDRLLVAEPGETFEMPNIVRFLVQGAMDVAEWNSNSAVLNLFNVMEEPNWERIPALVSKLHERSSNNRIDAQEIKKACREVGLEDRIDTLIALLKGSGIMSPNLAPIAKVTRTGSPIYELNPCVFAESRE